MTNLEKYGPAMEIEDQAAADAYFEKLVTGSMKQGITRELAEELERENLGYFAGYYSRDTMRRVNRLFKTRHPVITPEMTEEEIFRVGMKVGKKLHD